MDNGLMFNLERRLQALEAGRAKDNRLLRELIQALETLGFVQRSRLLDAAVDRAVEELDKPRSR